MINDSTKEFGPWRVVIDHDGYAPRRKHLRHRFQGVARGPTTDVGDLPPYVFSEIFHDLVTMTGTKSA